MKGPQIVEIAEGKQEEKYEINLSNLGNCKCFWMTRRYFYCEGVMGGKAEVVRSQMVTNFGC